MKAVDTRIWTGIERSGGRIRRTASRIMLLVYAYHLRYIQIVGVPVENEYYAIEALSGPAATEDQVRLMFQTLLAERFSLSVHRETRPLSSYSLSVGRNGPKFRELKADQKPSPLPAFLRGTSLPEGRFVSLNPGQRVLVGRRVGMAELAAALRSEISAIVRDQTGLTGNFDIDLAFQPDVAATGDGVEGQTVFAAVQDQLGLKLEKRTGPVEVLVVDRMEKKVKEN